MTRLCTVLLIATFCLTACGKKTQSPATEAAVPTNKKCVVSGDVIDPKDPRLPHVAYQGKTYALCCKDCIKDFNANPSKYVPAQ